MPDLTPHKFVGVGQRPPTIFGDFEFELSKIGVRKTLAARDGLNR